MGAALSLSSACKVPISSVNAQFTLADTSWFAAEETLFVFYEVDAEKGLSKESVIEIRFSTDEEVMRWTDLRSLPEVHTHETVDCGANTLCGSWSIRSPLEPRQVALRMRYHRDGDLALNTPTVFNVVGSGPAHSHRSLLIYGVFDESNRALQWRARHRFPTIRNERAQQLGLRRHFEIDTQWRAEELEEPQGDGSSNDPSAIFGSNLGAGLPGDLGSAFPPSDSAVSVDNPYLYGIPCESALPLSFPPLQTTERAIFNSEDLPDDAASAAAVCANSIVQTAAGPFETTAVARKNAQVRPAFPVLRSPIRETTPLKYLLSVCERTLSKKHLELQKQRLLLEDIEAICIDNWDTSLSEELAARFAADIVRARADGNDMVLTLALHHDAPRLRAEVEEALVLTLEPERTKATPRVVGAFVYDSLAHLSSDTSIAQTTLWCPASPPPEATGEEPDIEAILPNSSLACAVLFDEAGLKLGPLSIEGLPVFPTRAQYLNFLETYSEDQAGEVVSLSFRAPQLPPTTDTVAVPPFGIASFLNEESIAAEPSDAFSFCPTAEEYSGFVFRSPASSQVLPLSTLPEWHAATGERSYDLGIVWEFPYLLRIQFRSVVAAAVSAFSASLPFGFGVSQSQDFGSELWLEESFPLTESLAHCRRFCDHPTFDAAGIYQVLAPFRSSQQNSCYKPRYPERGDSGFPHDP